MSKRYRLFAIRVLGDTSPRNWILSTAQLRALAACFEEGIIMLEGGERTKATEAMEVIRAMQRYEAGLPPEPWDAVTVYGFFEATPDHANTQEGQ